MQTEILLKTTEKYLLIEQKIKTLCEPEVIETLKKYNQILKDNGYPNWHIISRGGDALNYYYTLDEYIPTHDWDIGFVRVPENGQPIYGNTLNVISQVAENLGKELANNFSYLFSNNKIKSNDFTIDYFKNYFNKSKRLSNIYYEYKYEKDKITKTLDIKKNSVVDIYIHGNFVDNNMMLNPMFDDILHYSPKLTLKSINTLKNNNITLDRNSFISLLQNNLKDRNFKNTFNYIIEDSVSKMKYVAPGDLLADTMRMIYQSVNNINIGENKLDKYLIKYSSLLDQINKMYNFCPNKSCRDSITAFVIDRDTNITNYSCIIPENFFLLFYDKAYIESKAPIIPAKKICEMHEILKYLK